MKKGEKALLTCREDYAYGKTGSPPKIPPEATLQFEVELLSFKSSNDLTHDGGVIRKIIKKGGSTKNPLSGSEVHGMLHFP